MNEKYRYYTGAKTTEEKGDFIFMKLNKVIATTALALSGFIAFNETTDVEAAEWQARTVEQVQADIQTEDGIVSTYTIQSGDTLAVIANAADVDLESLVANNGIEDANLIFPGNKLTFTEDASGHVKEVTVQDAAGNEEGSYEVSEQSYSAPAQEQTTTSNNSQSTSSYSSSVSGYEAAAKEWIAQRESGGSYTATNGQYYGRYQLNPTLVSYGASPAEQEAAADAYVSSTYGSWTQAKAAWLAKGWY